jgi:hypothetical protein
MAEKNNKDINPSDSKNTYDPDNCNSDDDLTEDEESEYSDLSVVPLDESDEVSDDIDDSKIIEENKAQVTAAQANFIKMMPFVRAFEMARKEGNLSEEDKRMRDALLYKLWSEVAFYARGLITAGMDTYIKDNDYRLDLEQDCRLIFYENLMNYNPEISAPTTYFKRYFLQKISEYKHKNSQHMTANEAKNVAKLRFFIQQHEKKGESYDYKTLSQESGISRRVVERTLRRMNTSRQANIEDVIIPTTKDMQPESVYIRREAEDTILKALTDTLTKDEMNFYYDRVYNNGNDNRHMPFKVLAERYNIQPHEAKEKWQTILGKLYIHPLLRKLLPRVNDDGMELNIHARATEAMQMDIESALISDGDIVPGLDLVINEEDSEVLDPKLYKLMAKVLSESEISFYNKWVFKKGESLTVVDIDNYNINYITYLSSKIAKEYSTAKAVLGKINSKKLVKGYINDPDNLTDYIRVYSNTPKKIIYDTDSVATSVVVKIQEIINDNLFTILNKLLSEDEMDFLLTKADSENGTIEEAAAVYGLTASETSAVWAEITTKLTSHPVIRKMFVSF